MLPLVRASAYFPKRYFGAGTRFFLSLFGQLNLGRQSADGYFHQHYKIGIEALCSLIYDRNDPRFDDEFADAQREIYACTSCKGDRPYREDPSS